MASEFLYIFCAVNLSMGSTRRGTRLSSTTYPSVRPILSSPLKPTPRLQFQSQLCLTRHDISSKGQPWETTVLQHPSRISAQHFNHTTPASSLITPNNPGKFTVRPTIILHAIPDKLNCVPALRPRRDSPCTTYFRRDMINPSHV